MGISTFPAPSGGGETNDFIIDKNDTTNTDFALGRAFAAGGYSVVVTGSTAYDIYLLDSTGSAVGYTNGTSVVASDAFESVSAIGLGTADTVAFGYNGPSTNATTAGTSVGAGPFLTSITPSDLPQIDDTAIVAGGNFASDVEISFISGTVTKAAKNVVVGSSTALVVTRPDDLIEDLAPYDLKAINPGTTEPTGSNANVLAGTVTAGTDPSFVTTSPILGAFSGTAFSTAILTSDSEGTVVSWVVTAGTLPSGLTLGSADGTLAGTPAASGDYYFTVEITDDGGNTNSAEFNLPVDLQFVGGDSTVVGGTTYVYFTASDDLVYKNATSTNVEYLVIAGGGGGGAYNGTNTSGGGGGGAGGLVAGSATLDGAGTVAVTIGGGGALHTNGEDTVLAGFATAIGGGGSPNNAAGSAGGSGAGGPEVLSGGTAVLAGAQGNNGAGGGGASGGGGGGKGSSGGGGGSNGGAGGAGELHGAYATAIGIIYDGGYFAGGAGGGVGTQGGADIGGDGGIGGGGQGWGYARRTSTAGSANSGGGGGGGALEYFGSYRAPQAGGSGLVVVRVP